VTGRRVFPTENDPVSVTPDEDDSVVPGLHEPIRIEARMRGASGPSNSNLFAAGRRFDRLRRRMLGAEPREQVVLDAIGQRDGKGRAEVRTAILFYSAVASLAEAHGPAAGRLILGGRNPFLTPKVVCDLAGCSPASQHEAMAKASRGLHPLGRRVADDSPRDWLPWLQHLDDLREAVALLRAAEEGWGQLVADRALAESAHGDAVAVRAVADGLKRALGQARSGRGRASPRPGGDGVPVAGGPVGRLLRRARAMTVAAASALPLALYQMRPPRPVLRALRAAAGEVSRRAVGLAALTRPLPSAGGSARLTGQEEPTREKGTYVVVMKSDRPAVVQVGRLGTHWLPPGYLLYVGSAHGAGGIAARTGRHRDVGRPLLWNVDHVKAVATTVEVWWTHAAEKVECDWAMALAATAEYSCPVPGFGSNDCKRCPAHFFHCARRPSAEAFVGSLQVAGRGAVPVGRQRI
jgi:Uri superfamily endonuclease